MCLWEFSWNFCDFQSIFRVFNQILGFSGIVFALKIISNKNYPIYLGRARRPDPGPHRPSRRPARGPSEPAGAHRPAAVHGGHAAAASCLVRARPGLLHRVPYKARRQRPVRPASCLTPGRRIPPPPCNVRARRRRRRSSSPPRFADLVP
jgi:hypothetical protein